MRRFASADELSEEEIRAADIRSIPRPSVLDKRVRVRGKKAAAGLETLGIATRGDLIEHLPHSHQDRSDVRTVASLGEGEEATVAVTMRSVTVKPTRRRGLKKVEGRVFDATGPLVAVWWNQPWLAREMGEGSQLLLHGTRKKRNEFAVKEHDVIGSGAGAPVHTVGRVPVHPTTYGLPASVLRGLIREQYGSIRHVVEPLPAALRIAERLPDRSAALAAVHFPDTEEDDEAGRHRLAFEELYLAQLAVAGRRQAAGRGRRAAPLHGTGDLVDPWRAALPFTLTADQDAAAARIDEDLTRERPMQRLLMGEVGSGKTAVALHAMLRTLEAGGQAALMAPTETLAEQHLLTVDRLLGGAQPVELLTGSVRAARRRDLLARLASGELNLVVGTHALLEDPVVFRSLGLVVVDEQHRFGVRQRAALDAKAPGAFVPHALHMTATPIPRTLHLTAYGDLETTVLRTLPAGRKPVETHVVDGSRARARAYERAREEIAAGRQVFVVCPLVSESEALQATAATDEAARLQVTEFASQRVSLIHGQMSSDEKQEAMRGFAGGDADVLVATSVIEVGIDVPNATVMIIESAERYGLSQLHQLRGRVGRGEHPSICILFGDPRLPRLEAIAGSRDGFALAEVDLELRGAGEVLGTRQSGMPEFRVARLPDDQPLLERARAHADATIAADPALELPEHALLRGAVIDRFGSDLDPIPA